jgi:hypothetical protein
MAEPPDDHFEEACEAFELQWIAGAEPPDLRAVLEGRRDHGDLAGLARELAMVDLEWRWRKAGERRRYPARWYHKRLREFGLSDDDAAQIARHELLVRSRWGDQPPVDKVAFGVPAPPLSLAQLHQTLNERFSVQILVAWDRRTKLKTTYGGPLNFGRQRSEDVAPVAVIATPPSEGRAPPNPEEPVASIVFAPTSARRISRLHYRVTRLSVDCFVTEVRGPGTPCRVDGRSLPLAEPVQLRLPFTITVDVYTTTFRRNW